MSQRITDLRKTLDEPHDELTGLADHMLALVPEGTQAIVLVDRGNGAGMGATGYEDMPTIVATMRRHLRAALLSEEAELRDDA